MVRTIFPFPVFERRLTKFLGFHPDLKKQIKEILKLLSQDVHSPSLKTHKLHGKLGSSYACSINHYYRIVFSFDENFVYLESVGSHDDVY